MDKTTDQQQPTHITGTDGVEYELMYSDQASRVKLDSLHFAVQYSQNRATRANEVVDIASVFETYLLS